MTVCLLIMLYLTLVAKVTMLADDGLVLEVDRFDPGRMSSQDHQMLLPTTTLPGDYVISLTVVSNILLMG